MAHFSGLTSILAKSRAASLMTIGVMAATLVASCGGSGSSAGGTGTTPGTTPAIRQAVQYMAYPGATSADWTVTLSDVQEGSTIYVVGVFPNFASTYPNMAVSDGTNAYTLLDRYDDLPLLNQGIKGSQTVAHWYAANVPAGSYSINMAPSPATYEDWVGVVAFEITGASTEPLDGHAISFQGDLAPGTNSLNVAVTNTSTQGLYIAFTFNDVDFVTPTAPLLGSGFTAAYGSGGSGALMDFTNGGKPSATAEYQAITAAGAHTATFSPQEPEGDGQYPDYMTTGVIFK